MNLLDISFAELAVCVVAGGAAGGIYFGGLWWTVNRLTEFVHPRLALLVSFAGRAVVALAIFYLAAGGRPAGYLACAIGFLVVRFAAVRLAKPEKAKEAA
jgi:F1F0 ATPase subunit 2